MAPKSKSKPAALTGSLLASKGTAGPSSQPKAPAADDATTTAVPPAEPDDVAVLTDGTGGFQMPVRLDPNTYVELRLAAARGGVTCQEIIQSALMRYLVEPAAGAQRAEPQAMPDPPDAPKRPAGSGRPPPGPQSEV